MHLGLPFKVYTRLFVASQPGPIILWQDKWSETFPPLHRKGWAQNLCWEVSCWVRAATSPAATCKPLLPSCSYNWRQQRPPFVPPKGTAYTRIIPLLVPWCTSTSCLGRRRLRNLFCYIPLHSMGRPLILPGEEGEMAGVKYPKQSKTVNCILSSYPDLCNIREYLKKRKQQPRKWKQVRSFSGDDSHDRRQLLQAFITTLL